MPENETDSRGSLVNIDIDGGSLTKPATVLVERISDAFGGIAKPWQIKRVARAEVEAKIIQGLGELQLTEIQQRAMKRVVHEEAKHQENIENITSIAIHKLEIDAKPEEIEEDWLAYFFDRSRIVSDAEMQEVWGKILAGEANASGAFSRRTLERVASLDKKDANLLTALCTFAWTIGDPTLLVFDINHAIYNDLDINFDSLTHLDDLGFVTFHSAGGIQKLQLPKTLGIYYFNKIVNIVMPQDGNTNDLEIGFAMFTKAGQELFSICGAVPNDEYFNFVCARMREKNIVVNTVTI